MSLPKLGTMALLSLGALSPASSSNPGVILTKAVIKTLSLPTLYFVYSFQREMRMQ